IRHFIAHRGFEALPSRRHGQPLPTLEHEADHLLRRLALSGVPVPPADHRTLELALTAEEQQFADDWIETQPRASGARMVGIGAGSKWPSKCWPESGYRERGRQLVRQMGVHPVVLGGPEDVAMARRLV